jgi:hypothetical protein
VYVGVSQELGLRIGREYHLDDISTEALVAEASTWGIGQSAARAAIEITALVVLETVSTVRDQLRAEGRDHPKIDELQARVVRVANSLRRHD